MHRLSLDPHCFDMDNCTVDTFAQDNHHKDGCTKSILAYNKHRIANDFPSGGIDTSHNKGFVDEGSFAVVHRKKLQPSMHRSHLIQRWLPHPGHSSMLVLHLWQQEARQ